MKLDRNLTDDTMVTFSFVSANTSGYTFVTSHSCDCLKRTFVFDQAKDLRQDRELLRREMKFFFP